MSDGQARNLQFQKALLVIPVRVIALDALSILSSQLHGRGSVVPLQTVKECREFRLVHDPIERVQGDRPAIGATLCVGADKRPRAECMALAQAECMALTVATSGFHVSVLQASFFTHRHLATQEVPLPHPHRAPKQRGPTDAPQWGVREVQLRPSGPILSCHRLKIPAWSEGATL